MHNCNPVDHPSFELTQKIPMHLLDKKVPSSGAADQANIYLFKVTIETLEKLNFEHISHLFLMFLLVSLNK